MGASSLSACDSANHGRVQRALGDVALGNNLAQARKALGVEERLALVLAARAAA